MFPIPGLKPRPSQHRRLLLLKSRACCFSTSSRLVARGATSSSRVLARLHPGWGCCCSRRLDWLAFIHGLLDSHLMSIPTSTPLRCAQGSSPPRSCRLLGPSSVAGMLLAHERPHSYSRCAAGGRGAGRHSLGAATRSSPFAASTKSRAGRGGRGSFCHVDFGCRCHGDPGPGRSRAQSLQPG